MTWCSEFLPPPKIIPVNCFEVIYLFLSRWFLKPEKYKNEVNICAGLSYWKPEYLPLLKLLIIPVDVLVSEWVVFFSEVLFLEAVSQLTVFKHQPVWEDHWTPPLLAGPGRSACRTLSCLWPDLGWALQSDSRLAKTHKQTRDQHQRSPPASQNHPSPWRSAWKVYSEVVKSIVSSSLGIKRFSYPQCTQVCVFYPNDVWKQCFKLSLMGDSYHV